jgi:hypothetical protein
MIKLATLMVLTLAGASAADLFHHLQQAPVDVYVSSYADHQPDIPGMGKTDNGIAVSISTTDELAVAYQVYVRVRLEDGSEAPFLFTLENDRGTSIACRKLSTGNLKPVKIVHMWLQRLHAEPTDQLIKDLT